MIKYIKKFYKKAAAFVGKFAGIFCIEVYAGVCCTTACFMLLLMSYKMGDSTGLALMSITLIAIVSSIFLLILKLSLIEVRIKKQLDTVSLRQDMMLATWMKIVKDNKKEK